MAKMPKWPMMTWWHDVTQVIESQILPPALGSKQNGVMIAITAMNEKNATNRGW